MTQSDRTPNSTPTPDGITGPAAGDDASAGSGPRDPVTGKSGNATGEQQAAENEENDPVA